MQIHFSKSSPAGKTTYFIENIWATFLSNDFLWKNYDGNTCCDEYKEEWPYNQAPNFYFPLQSFDLKNPSYKIHTIRKNAAARWKPGMLIDFVQWTSKPYHSPVYKFAPSIPCISLQKIEILWIHGNVKVYIDDKLFAESEPYHLTLSEDFQNLIANDGMLSFQDFHDWFPINFSGTIIHWTDFKY